MWFCYWHAAGLLLSAVWAGDIYRPGAQQERCRSTALSSKFGQYFVDSQVDEAEPVVIAVLSDSRLL